ncbi:hypothetical protein [Cetobacterium ceti]
MGLLSGAAYATTNLSMPITLTAQVEAEPAIYTINVDGKAADSIAVDYGKMTPSHAPVVVSHVITVVKKGSTFPTMWTGTFADPTLTTSVGTSVQKLVMGTDPTTALATGSFSATFTPKAPGTFTGKTTLNIVVKAG